MVVFSYSFGAPPPLLALRAVVARLEVLLYIFVPTLVLMLVLVLVLVLVPTSTPLASRRFVHGDYEVVGEPPLSLEGLYDYPLVGLPA